MTHPKQQLSVVPVAGNLSKSFGLTELDIPSHLATLPGDTAPLQSMLESDLGQGCCLGAMVFLVSEMTNQKTD